MTDSYVVLEVGCLECSNPTYVRGIFDEELEATRLALRTLRADMGISLKKPDFGYENHPTLLWWGQAHSAHSVEVHRWPIGDR